MHLREMLEIQRVVDFITHRSAILQHRFSFSVNSPEQVQTSTFFILKPTEALIAQIYLVKKVYMFRAVPLPIIRSFPEELPETSRVSWLNKVGQLVRLLVLV
jgi:hypothetical protein